MAHLYHPHYTEVRVSLNYEHSDGTRRSATLVLTPENTTDLTREAMVSAVTGAMELMQFVRPADTSSADPGRTDA